MTRRRRLIFAFLSLVLGLFIAVWLFLSSAWGLSLALRMASAALPGQLMVAEHQGSLLGPVRLRGLRYQNQEVSLSLDSAELDWRILPLLYGKLVLSTLSLDKLDIQLHPGKTETNDNGAAPRLPLSFEINAAEIHTLTIRSEGERNPVRIDALQLSASSAGKSLLLKRFEISGYNTSVRLDGVVNLAESYPMKLNLDLSYTAANAKTYTSKGTLQGDMQALHIQQTVTTGPAVSLTATVRELIAKPQWDAQLEIVKLNPHTIIATAPDIAISGGLETRGDMQGLSADGDLQVSYQPIGSAQLKIHGQSDITFTEYSFKLAGNARGKTVPELALSVQGRGDRQGLSLDNLAMSVLRGTVNGKARFDWRPQLSLSSDLQFSNLQSAEVFKDWPGVISGRLKLQRKPAASLLPIAFDLQHVKGSLRKQPLQADIRGSWSERQVVLDQLQLNLGDSSLQAQGRLTRRWDLGFQFKSAQLEQLLPDVRGKLELNGRLQGSSASPHLQLQAQGSMLGYAHTRIKSLRLDMDMGLAAKDPANLNLLADEVRFRGEQWQRLSLLSSGSSQSHRIELQAGDDKQQLQMQLHGAYKAWQWQGALDSMVISTSNHGVWQLQSPADIELARHHYHLSRLCVAQDKVYVCTQLRWNGRDHQATLDARELPVALLNPWLPQQLKLDGVLNAEGNIQATRTGVLQAQLSVQSPENSIRLNFPESKDQIALGTVSLTARLDRAGMQAQLKIPLSKGGGLQAEFSLPNWRPQLGLSRNQAILASLQIDEVPADLMTLFFPDLTQARGTLYASLKVGGRLGAPQMSGDVRWRDGMVAVPVLGINVQDIKVDLKTEHPNTVLYTLSARSGGGDLQLDGQTRLQPDKGWPTVLRLRSHNLEVSNIPQAYIVVDSEARMEVQDESVHIDGTITIPQARLKPKTLPEDALSASPDVIVIRKRHTMAQQSHWQVSTRLRVSLGDKVDFNGFGIHGKLHGSIILTDAPGKLLMGQGELNITEGMYRIHGRDLNIRRSRLIFSNTFIDDPALDVEAVRIIDNVTAGVRIKGTLKHPRLTVFSEPAMPETEVLAYLTLGHSLAQSTQAEGQSVNRTASALGFIAGDYLEQGIGGPLGLDELRVDVNQTTQNTSLVVGKYISSKLYLRYYNGIAASSRLVQLQYQISRRVQIQTESGYKGTQSTTGGDIFFTIEY